MDLGLVPKHIFHKGAVYSVQDLVVKLQIFNDPGIRVQKREVSGEVGSQLAPASVFASSVRCAEENHELGPLANKLGEIDCLEEQLSVCLLLPSAEVDLVTVGTIHP